VSQLPPFFVSEGDSFVPSASARGPWSPRHQHGGPPALLLELPLMSGDDGYHRAVEWRIATGTWGRGPVAEWLRLRVPLVAGETPTPPLECLVAIADSASGIAVAVDRARATFVNADLTIALRRLPAGEWMCLDAPATAERDGVGLTRARLWDTSGPVGRSLQTLLLEPRAGVG
jgi:hypothetical protein